MAVGAVGIQGCGGVPGVTHMQGGIQHNIGVPGSQTSAHLHGQVMSSEDERKVNHIKEFEIVVALILLCSIIQIQYWNSTFQYSGCERVLSFIGKV